MRDNITEIIELLIIRGVSETEAPLIAAELIAIGARAAVYRRETADAVADISVEREQRKGRCK